MQISRFGRKLAVRIAIPDIGVEITALRPRRSETPGDLFRNLGIKIAPAGDEGHFQLIALGPVVKGSNGGRRHAAITFGPPSGFGAVGVAENTQQLPAAAFPFPYHREPRPAGEAFRPVALALVEQMVPGLHRAKAWYRIDD